MDLVSPAEVIVWILTGAVTSWLADRLLKAKGFGLAWDIPVGVVGAILGGLAMPMMAIDLELGFVPGIANAFIGACILLVIARLLKR